MLNQLHQQLRSHSLFYRLTLASRILLAVGFIPTGIVKLLGQPFSLLDPSIPAGAIFQILYEGGIYWQFLGAAQIVAGICLLIPATATLGALFFLPIMLNIVMITIGYQFGATTLITLPMLLANLYLLAWDYDRLQGLVGFPAAVSGRAPSLFRHQLGDKERVIYLIGTLSGLLLFAGLRNLLPWGLSYEIPIALFFLVAFLSAAAAAGVGLVSYWQVYRKETA